MPNYTRDFIKSVEKLWFDEFKYSGWWKMILLSFPRIEDSVQLIYRVGMFYLFDWYLCLFAGDSWKVFQM